MVVGRLGVSGVLAPQLVEMAIKDVNARAQTPRQNMEEATAWEGQA